MRKIFSLAILGLCLLAPVQRLDVAKLEPVETVAMYLQGEQIVLETDGGDRGVGETAGEALINLKENALSVIYLDTAQYLLLGEGAQPYVEALRPALRKGVKVGPYSGGDLKEETRFLQIHGDLPNLESWNWTP